MLSWQQTKLSMANSKTDVNGQSWCCGVKWTRQMKTVWKIQSN